MEVGAAGRGRAREEARKMTNKGGDKRTGCERGGLVITEVEVEVEVGEEEQSRSYDSKSN